MFWHTFFSFLLFCIHFDPCYVHCIIFIFSFSIMSYLFTSWSSPFSFLFFFTYCIVVTLCPGSSDPFYKVTYYIKWVITSWTHSTLAAFCIGHTWYFCRVASYAALNSKYILIYIYQYNQEFNTGFLFFMCLEKIKIKFC